jgi:hypothetical protein
MPNKNSKAVDASSAFCGFATIPDSELVAGILDDRARRDPCPGFSAFIGAATKRRLQSIHAERLTDAGLAPNVYLAIRWWCLFFIPVIPLGAYAVADYRSIDRPFSDPHSRAIPVAMDWRIVGAQAAFGLSVVVFAISIGLWVISR